jgi:hypothetical protein
MPFQRTQLIQTLIPTLLTRMRLMPRPEGRGGIRQSEGVSMAPSD